MSDIRWKWRCVVAQFTDILGDNSRIPDRVKTDISVVATWYKRKTYFRIRPSNLNIATLSAESRSHMYKMGLTSITTLISPAEMEWLM